MDTLKKISKIIIAVAIGNILFMISPWFLMIGILGFMIMVAVDKVKV